MSFKIETLWAFVAEEPGDDEGIIAERVGGAWLPFIADQTRPLRHADGRRSDLLGGRVTPPEIRALKRARELVHRMHAACEAITGDARFTVVVAVPVEGDPGGMIVETAGNGSERITDAMLEKAQVQHVLLRKNAGPLS